MAILGLVVLVALILRGHERSNPGTAISNRDTAGKPGQTPSEQGINFPPQVAVPRTSLAATIKPAAVAVPVAGEGLVPGHFPGITVQHQPLADHRSAGEPKAGVVTEVTTRSGHKLLRVRTSERDDIPVRPSPAK